MIYKVKRIDEDLVLGAPAKVVKQLSEAQIEGIKESAKEYVELAREHKLIAE